MLGAVAFLAAAAARAANPPITVTTSDDASHTCASSGAPPCSLRDAIVYANATAGADAIVFDIAPAGLHAIAPATEYPAITGPLTIDGYTQPASGGGTAHPNTLAVGNDALILIEIDASGVPSSSHGILDFEGGPGAIRGLAIHGAPNGTPGAIRVAASGVTVAGNFVGTDATGATHLANGCNGVRIEGDDNVVGGATPADRNLITGTDGCAINLILTGASNTVVQGNYLGTNAAGTAIFGGMGIDVADGSANNRIGGTGAGEGNLISTGFDPGVRIRGAATTGNRVEGNLIGTNASGTGALGNSYGVQFFEEAHDNVIGGDSANAGNVIAHGSQAGVTFDPGAGTGNAILSNAIFANAGLGIDLMQDGPTPNDVLDADAGPNALQNFPILTAVSESGVEGILRSAPNKSYTVQFFANASCDPSGFGQGKTLVQTAVVATDTAGKASFGASLTLPAGLAVSATATEASAGTSEFSPCVLLVPAALAVDGAGSATSDGNGVLEPGETASVAPTWQNGTSADVTTAGQASAPTGPAGATYASSDGSADYGTIAPGTAGSCAKVPNCYAMSAAPSPGRPLTHWDARFTETLPGAASQSHAWTLHLGDSFTDVPRLHPFYKRIETVLHTGVALGCGATQYCPTQKVPRDQMAIFLARAIAGGGPNIPSSGTVNAQSYDCSPGGTSLFTDVAPTAPACKSIHFILAQNVTSGCAPSLYCPAALISRGEMSLFVAKGVVAPGGGAAVPTTYGPDPVTGLSYSCNPASPNLHFTDVSTADPFCRHVHYLWAKGAIGGCSPTQYCSGGQVGRDEMSKFLSNAFGLKLYGP